MRSSTVIIALAFGILIQPAARAAGSHGDEAHAGKKNAYAHGTSSPAAFGRPGSPDEVDRTVEVELADIRFDRTEIAVTPGETIRFVLRNTGRLLHEFNIGTPAMHEAHQKEMLEMFAAGRMTATGRAPAETAGQDEGHEKHQADSGKGHGHGETGGGHHAGGNDGAMAHDDPGSVLVEPGDTRELLWHFEKARNLEFACNVPGHYPAGMVGEFRFVGGAAGG